MSSDLPLARHLLERLRDALRQDTRVIQANGLRQVLRSDSDALPNVSVDPQTYEVFADGELLTCEPAEVLPLAQRYLLL